MDKIIALQEMIDDSKRIVFFGGAGVSTESGIPDFRSVDGLYNQRYKYSPETILSHTFFMDKTEEFYDFYKNKMIFSGVEPNNAHIMLAKLEEAGKLTAVVTQNIDNLHQMAGSKNVLDLHGSVYRNYCMKCKKFYDINDVMNSKTVVPKCDCGGIIKPDVVLYEESLSNDTIRKTIDAISDADMLIIGGTSLVVYPAAGLVNYYNGNKLVLINKDSTRMDSKADLVISQPIGKVLGQIRI